MNVYLVKATVFYGEIEYSTQALVEDTQTPDKRRLKKYFGHGSESSVSVDSIVEIDRSLADKLVELRLVAFV